MQPTVSFKKNLFHLLSAFALLSSTLVTSSEVSDYRINKPRLIHNPKTGDFEPKPFIDLVLHKLTWEERAAHFPRLSEFTKVDWLYLLKAYRPELKDEDLDNVDKMLVHAKGAEYFPTLDAFVLECLCQLEMHEMIEKIRQKHPTNLINFATMPGPAICLSRSLTLDFHDRLDALTRAIQFPCARDNQLIDLENHLFPEITPDESQDFWKIIAVTFQSNRVDFFEHLLGKLKATLETADDRIRSRVTESALSQMLLQPNQKNLTAEQLFMIDRLFEQSESDHLKRACGLYPFNTENPICAAVREKCKKLKGEMN